jgi:CO/xanthine dehydrogenase FAD-binding subunit/carbon monoxide dehydrogenase subunit G
VQTFVYLRPSSVAEAVKFANEHVDARLLAGGQSLLAAMKLGLNTPSHLIDLQDVPGLQDIRLDGDTLHIGAMVTHARIARSLQVRAFCPMLAELAQGIADEQVRAVGTIGGSLANNDPAACWPAGVLALGATLVTSTREIAADDFFQGLYGTALENGELLLAIRFPRPLVAHYRKHEQPASRFAMVGVAVVRFDAGRGAAIRVAITGLGHGVLRWTAAEQALSAQWQLSALDTLAFPSGEALGDVHASAVYRAHLVVVMCRRAVSSLTGEVAVRSSRAVLPRTTASDTVAVGAPAPESAVPTGTVLTGKHLLQLPLARVWEGILDPLVLQRCIPGCENMQALGAHRYAATVKVGIGPVSARFQTQIALTDLRPPDAAGLAACSMRFEGQAGGLGHGQGTAKVRLGQAGQGTQLDWQARTQVSGRIAQFGNRLIEATAHKLSDQFFERFAAVLQADSAAGLPAAATRLATPSLFQALRARLERFLHAIFRR